MTAGQWRATVAGLALAATQAWPVQAGHDGPFTATRAAIAAEPAPPQAPDAAVPGDLKPLLAARQSEMRLVVSRYALDRNTLAGNYAGGSGRGGGRGGGRAGGAAAGAPAQQVENVPLSPARIARLKRFDLDWQAAVAKIDPARLTPEARTDLETLKASIATNLAQLEADTATLAEVAASMPYAAPIVQLVEARIRIDPIDARKAAGTITDVVKTIARTRSRLESGLTGASADGLRLTRAQALRAATATETLRAITTEWFTFYNGYDPLFTWWMNLPYKHVDGALQAHAAFLREKIAPADQAGTISPTVTPIQPGPAPKFNQVPDLQEIIALPQDEMIAIVQRFNAGRGGRGGRGVAAAPEAGPAYYQAWLAALKTLDFDALSRNAQVDYLHLRTVAERQIARAGRDLPPNPPRKTDNSGIEGAARGREGLIRDLQDEMIPYTPEELIALANAEYAWIEAEFKKASRQLGFGDDWKKAIEHVKDLHVPPGGQPIMIRDLLTEATEWLRSRDLLTVPQVAAESLHMIMMTPERQLVNPFFTGGGQISVSYPTNTMEYDARIQSMRGNNDGFSHATAGHEMIPGHNLVGFIGSRFSGYRASLAAGTPFFGEGWPLYWELTFYDMGFHRTPEMKIGALFWRMHRAARIIFSLNFHMGLWSPQECIDFLVDKVGHERDNATAEVRRSFQGNYSPLYQAAYLLGGMQLRGLRRELVDSGQMTNKRFHDEILRQGSMPIALLRLGVTRQKLTRDMVVDWKFYGENPGK